MPQGSTRGANVHSDQAAVGTNNPEPTSPPESNPPTEPGADVKHPPQRAAEKSPDLYVISATTREGQRIVELHDEQSAEARHTELTHGSKQRRKEAEEAGEEVPEGGGSYELNPKDVTVYKLATTPHRF